MARLRWEIGPGCDISGIELAADFFWETGRMPESEPSCTSKAEPAKKEKKAKREEVTISARGVHTFRL